MRPRIVLLIERAKMLIRRGERERAQGVAFTAYHLAIEFDFRNLEKEAWRVFSDAC